MSETTLSEIVEWGFMPLVEAYLYCREHTHNYVDGFDWNYVPGDLTDDGVVYADGSFFLSVRTV